MEACLETWTSSAEYGVYNVVNSGSVNAEEVIKLIRKHLPFEKEVKFMSDAAEFYTAVNAIAPRSNCVLDNSKLLSCGIKMRDAYEAIEDSLENWKKNG